MLTSRFYNYNIVKLQVKYFSGSCVAFRNHYDSLGVTAKATQSEIKTAYYKLSKLYHPDKNKGCLDASKKFQDISNAYEVLGNFKIRKLYDKGLLPSHVGRTYNEHTTEYPEHPEAEFYKSREIRRTASSTETPIYDFDEWSKAHYGETFQRAARARQRWAHKQEKEKQISIDIKNEKIIFTIFIVIFVCVGFSFMGDDEDKVK